MKTCYNCGSEWLEDFKPGFSSTCDSCGQYVHCCMNCRFYNSTRYNNCSEPIAERVPDVESKNFCSYFEYVERESTFEKPPTSSKKSFYDLFTS